MRSKFRYVNRDGSPRPSDSSRSRTAGAIGQPGGGAAARVAVGLREQDRVLRSIHVNRRPERGAPETADVARLVRGEALFPELLVADGDRRELEPARRAEVRLVQEGRVQEAVDERGSPERAVERETDGLTRARLDQERRARRHHGFLQDVEAVDPRAHDPAIVVRQNDLVLPVHPAFIATGAARREREVEVVVPIIAAVGKQVTCAHDVEIRELDVVGLILEPEIERPAIEAALQDGRRLTVQRVHEPLQLQPAARVGHAAVLQRRAALHVERSESGENDPFGSCNAAGQDDLLPPVRHVVVGPCIELRLRRASVLERRVGRLRARHQSPSAAGTAPVPAVPPTPCRQICCWSPPHAWRGRKTDLRRRTIRPVRERSNWPKRIVTLVPCISRGVFVITLTTPVMALAPHTADAGPRMTSICLISLRVDRQEVPRHEPEEVLIDGAPIQEDEQGI